LPFSVAWSGRVRTDGRAARVTRKAPQSCPCHELGTAAPAEAALSGALRAIRTLKGGTALNLFFRDVPRLSVDIDVNYVGQGDLEAMHAVRPAFEAALVACCEREDCVVRRAPTEHAGVAATEPLLAWTDREREFIDGLCDRGEIAAELIADDASDQAVVREQPLLQWKAQHVREYRKRR
jgi:hypothetical protein